MTTTKLLIPEMTASQSQKHVTFNEALFTLDNLVQLSVLDKDLTAAPGSPTLGDTYIVGNSATGSWLGKDAQVASYDGDGWIFFPPNDGWFCWVDDEAEIYFYNGGWSALGDVLGSGYLSLGGGTLTGNLVLEEASPSIRFNDTDLTGYTLLQTSGATYEIAVDPEDDDASSKFQVTIDGASANFEVNEYGLGIGGASADATNSFSFYGTNVLLNSGSDIDMKYNKAAPSDDATMTFQTGFSSRALIGTMANDDFKIKVSPNGSTFYTGLTIDKDSGKVGVTALGGSMSGEFTVSGAIDLNADYGSRNVRGLRLNKNTGASGDNNYLDLGYSTVSGIWTMSQFVSGAATSTDFQLGVVSSSSTDLYVSGTNGYVGLGVTPSTDRLRVAGVIAPASDNTYTLGRSGARWSEVWAANGTIQTSDERDKNVKQRLSGSVAMSLIDQIDPVIFNWKEGGGYFDAKPMYEGQVAENQSEIDEALDNEAITPRYLHVRPGVRDHAGFLSQEVKKALDANDLDFGVWGLDDKDDPDSRQFLRPDQLVPVLWASVKQLQEQVARLETSLKDHVNENQS